MSRVVIPRAYRLKIASSSWPRRRRLLGTIFGSKLDVRSRGTAIHTGPTVHDRGQDEPEDHRPEEFPGHRGGDTERVPQPAHPITSVARAAATALPSAHHATGMRAWRPGWSRRSVRRGQLWVRSGRRWSGSGPV